MAEDVREETGCLARPFLRARGCTRTTPTTPLHRAHPPPQSMLIMTKLASFARVGGKGASFAMINAGSGALGGALNAGSGARGGALNTGVGERAAFTGGGIEAQPTRAGEVRRQPAG